MLSRAEEYRWRYMITLTYGELYPKVFEAKAQMRAFLKKIRRTFGRCTFLWRMEFQKRGAPHFHILASFAREISGTHLKYVGIRAWTKTQRKMHNSSWNKAYDKKTYKEKASHQYGFKLDTLESSRGGMKYVSKYAGKIDQNEPLATVGRRWGLEGKNQLTLGAISRCLSVTQARELEYCLHGVLGEERHQNWLEFGKIYLDENEWKLVSLKLMEFNND